jgi:hypothetical protein
MSGEPDKKLFPLEFSIDEDMCTSSYSERLSVQVVSVQGTSTRAGEGEIFTAKGSYTLNAKYPLFVRLAALGTSKTENVVLAPGSGEFELTSYIVDAIPGREHQLDILTPDDAIITRIELK